MSSPKSSNTRTSSKTGARIPEEEWQRRYDQVLEAIRLGHGTTVEIRRYTGLPKSAVNQCAIRLSHKKLVRRVTASPQHPGLLFKYIPTTPTP
jgi:hypothetical protein